MFRTFCDKLVNLRKKADTYAMLRPRNNASTNKTATLAILVICTLLLSSFALPTVSSQVSGTRKTYAFIGANPNPVSVNNQVAIHFGITHEVGTATSGWAGLTVTVTAPDNTVETLGPFKTDSTGGSASVYTPTMVGTYYLQTHFPEQTMPSTSAGTSEGTTMLASDSEILALVVQSDPITYWPGLSPPTEYWSRPINSQLWEWNPVAGNWLEPRAYFVSTYAPYNLDAPESAHLLWTKTLVGGGLAGGMSEPYQYEAGGAYEDKFKNSVIIAGVLYYNRFESRGGTNIEQDVVAVDLHTGEELWVENWNNSRLAFGQAFNWNSYNYQGVFGYLWSTTGSIWDAYDPTTGRWVYEMTNVPSGTNIYGPMGEIYRFTVNTAEGWMTLWNSSRVVSDAGSWRPHGQIFNCSWDAPRHGGYEWNITIPNNLPGSAQGFALGDKVFGGIVNGTGVYSWALSLKPGEEGTLLYTKTWAAPAEWIEGARTNSARFSEVSLDDKVFTVVYVDTRQHWGFSTETGEYIWGPTEPQNYLEVYQEAMAIIADGRYLCGTTSGTIYSYDVATGELQWTYNATDPFHTNPVGINFPLRAPAALVVDGKLYGGYGEHSPNNPQPRGTTFFCLDLETGKEIWSQYMNVASYSYTPLIGDSIIATLDSHDNRIYAIGKGPTATVVSASPKTSVQGDSVLVEGRVTDISPGTEEYALTARFPDGVPAVSDASMSEWMRYVYNQFPRPTNATGVEVVISVLDPNNNSYEVGRTTSDASGFFKVAFTPPVPGEYTVTASFAGSNSYWPSQTETAIAVSEEPAAKPITTSTPPPTQTVTPFTPTPAPSQPVLPSPSEVPQPSTNATPTTTYIVISVAVIVVIAATAVTVLRRRK